MGAITDVDKTFLFLACGFFGDTDNRLRAFDKLSCVVGLRGGVLGPGFKFLKTSDGRARHSSNVTCCGGNSIKKKIILNAQKLELTALWNSISFCRMDIRARSP